MRAADLDGARGRRHGAQAPSAQVQSRLPRRVAADRRAVYHRLMRVLVALVVVAGCERTGREPDRLVPVELPASPAGDTAIGSIWGEGSDVWVVGDRSIWRTRDGGATWTLTPILAAERETVLGRLWGLDAQHLVLTSSDDGVRSSADGGSTWAQVGKLQGYFLRDDGRGGLIALDGFTGVCRIVGSTDGGRTFTERWRGAQCGLGRVTQDQEGLVAVGDRIVEQGLEPLVLRSADGGTTWADVSAGVTADVPSLSFGDSTAVDGALIAACSGMWLCRSIDGGHTWKRTGTLPTAPATDHALLAFLAGDGRYALAWRQASGLGVASTDAGLTWSTIPAVPAGAEIIAAMVSRSGDVWLGGRLVERPLLLHGKLATK